MIKKTFNLDTKLTAGGNGIFDLKLNDQLVFSKYKESRFPEDDEALKLLKEKGVKPV